MSTYNIIRLLRVNDSIPGSVLVHISFHYRADKVKHLKRVMRNVRSYGFSRIDVVIDTNCDESREICLRLFPSDAKVTVRCSVHYGLKHPFDLTWKHREHMGASIDHYEFFMYLEDDILVPWPAIRAWYRDTLRISPYDYSRGILESRTQFI